MDHHLVSKVPDILNWVTHSGVAVKTSKLRTSSGLTLQDIFKQRGIGDSGSGLFYSTLELKFSLLDPPLDQFVQDLDAGRFFNFFLSLAVISFYLDTR